MITAVPLHLQAQEEESQYQRQSAASITNVQKEPALAQSKATQRLDSGPSTNSQPGLRFQSFGGRFGISAKESSDTFRQAEVFAFWDLPWAWDLGSRLKCRLQTHLEASAGWLGSRNENAFVGTVGAGLLFTRDNIPLSLALGFRPTVLSRSDFTERDFGIPFQFTSSAGVRLDVSRRFSLGYQCQHMSNAGLSSRNPGLNMHMFGACLRF
jgi:hypothetical protein